MYVVERVEQMKVFRELQDLIPYARPTYVATWVKTWNCVPVLNWIAAAVAFKDGDFFRAAQRYERGLRRHPRHPARVCALLDYAHSLFRIGELSEARSVAYQAIAEGGQMPELYILIGRIEMLFGAPLKAREIIERAIQVSGATVHLKLCLAHASIQTAVDPLDLNDIREDLLELRATLPLTDPALLSVDTAIAIYESRFGDTAIGERLLSRVLATGQGPIEASLFRAESYLEQGRVSSARDLLDRITLSAPHDPRAITALAHSYLMEGNFNPDYAKQLALTACRRSNWENPKALQILTEACTANGDEDGAALFGQQLRSITTIASISPDSLDKVNDSLTQLRGAKFPSA